jgi:hypothetical protein
MRNAVLVLISMAFVGLIASSATLRVPTDYATIQAAVDAAAPGDTILISPGVYDESVTIESKTGLTIKGDVTFTAKGEECCPDIWDEVGKVVIKGPVRILDSSDITVEALTISPHGLYVRGTTASPVEKVTFHYVQIIASYKDGMNFVGVYKDIQLLGCNISENGWDGIDLADWGDGILIENCCINYNGRTRPTGVGVRIGPYVKNVVIRANCLVGNAFAAIHPG